MADLIVLVHAPVLGPASWRPVADELTARGAQVAIPSLAGFTDSGPPYAPALVRVFAGQLKAAAAADRVVLVVHSGAGPFAPHLAAAVPAGPRELAVVFADAGLPASGRPTPVVDDTFLPYLRNLARDGLVPPWPQWFPDADPAELYPSQAARAAVLEDARPLPLSFFTEQLASVADLAVARYLLFSEGYRTEAEQARRRGWPVSELPGTHLHMLADPAAVAAALLSW
ncbi:MAG TPA: alpha/beta fold hydrolase [Streptosporangiaceae bacterium]|jgi:hypothetical protein|nr:alpha/beta fold hydrolase [Streptosporangiaceae bacterium]